MKRNIVTAAAIALTVAASSAQAQVAKPITFGVSGGAAIPTGKMSDGVNAGFGLTGLADFKAPTMPVNFRAELGYNRFGAKDLPSGIDGHSRILSGIMNAVMSIPTAGGVQPYVLGGPGVYSMKAIVTDGDVEVSSSKTAMGLNGGMGLNFHVGRFSSFAEARYHYIFSKDENKGFENAQTIPLSFGIRF
jgi:opacity protein-like surface antigen